MTITAQDIINALCEVRECGGFVNDDAGLDMVTLDGTFDLEALAEKLNAKLPKFVDLETTKWTRVEDCTPVKIEHHPNRQPLTP